MVHLRGPLSISLAATALLAFAAGAQTCALSTEFLRLTTAEPISSMRPWGAPRGVVWCSSTATRPTSTPARQGNSQRGWPNAAS